MRVGPCADDASLPILNLQTVVDGGRDEDSVLVRVP